MNGKEIQIIRTAVRLFAEHGYRHTSMQKIADDLGIAKGTLYMHFKSKEELLLKILEDYQNEMLKKVAVVARDDSLSPEQKLRKEIDVQLKEFETNGNFIKTIVWEQLNHKSKNVQRLMFDFRKKMLNLYKHTLLHTYGEELRPYLWDLVMALNSLLHSYMHLLLFDKKPIDTRHASAFISDCLDGMVSSVLAGRPEPVLTAEMMVDMEETDHDARPQEKNLSIELKRFREAVQQTVMDRSRKKEWLDAVDFLKEELQAKNPRQMVVKSVLQSMDGIPEWREFVRRIKLYIELNFQT